MAILNMESRGEMMKRLPNPSYVSRYLDVKTADLFINLSQILKRHR